jgi:O-antigen ligase
MHGVRGCFTLVLSMLLRRELMLRLFRLFLILMVIVGVASLLLDVFAGTEIIPTLLRIRGTR